MFPFPLPSPAADFSADLVLVLLPIRLLWRIKLAPGRRALLTGIFSASMLTTAVSIVHGVYVFSPDRNGEGIWAHVLVSVPARSPSLPASHADCPSRPCPFLRPLVQASTALMVCNLAVLVTWFLRAAGLTSEIDERPSARTPSGHTASPGGKDLTTLRFNHHTGPIVLRTLDSDGQDKTVGSVLSTECGTAKAAHPRDEDGGDADEHGVYAALGSKSDPGEVSTPGIAV